MMDDRSLNVLDFFHLLDLLKECSSSPLGRKRCEALRPSSDLPFIRSRLAEVLELKEIGETVAPPPINGLKDVEGILKRLEVKEAVLTIQELMDIYDQMTLYGGVKRFFDKLEKVRFPRLQERVSKLSSLKSLEKQILRAVNTKGEILDSASPNLSEIRANPSSATFTLPSIDFTS